MEKTQESVATENMSAHEPLGEGEDEGRDGSGCHQGSSRSSCMIKLLNGY